MGLGARLATVFAAVAAATALLVGGASYITADRQVTAEVDDFLRDRAGEITNGDREQPKNRRDRDEIDLGAAGNEAEVQVLDGNGDIVSNTGLLLPVAAADVALAERDDRAITRTVTIDGVDYRMRTDHVAGGGAIQVARSLDASTTLLDVLQTRLIIVAGALGLLAAGVGWVVAQRTTRPLRALTNAVDEVAETQDFSMPVDAAGSDEIGRLGRGFNRMLSALQTSREQQQQLVQDAAHELRTPLTSITANVDWLMHAPDLEPAARTAALSSVRRELSELNEVIAEIIELATDSRQTSEFRPTDLVAVVEEAAEQFRRRSGREVVVLASPTSVLGDAEGLGRAVGNLLSNAGKYSPEGSAVHIEVGPSGVFVDDAGPGIPLAERAMVFDRFYRRVEDRSKPGSGLGLSIVAGIVEQHGGEVNVTDSSLGGARVGFRLPLV